MGQKTNIGEYSAEKFRKVLEKIGKDEFEQILVRLAVAAVAILYTSLATRDLELLPLFGYTYSLPQLFSIGYFLSGIIIFNLLYIFTVIPAIRRVSMMILDIGFISSAMAIIPDAALPLFFIYFLVIFGFGFRFGNAYLLTAVTLCFTGFSAAFLLNDYWIEHKEFSIGLSINMVLASVYVSFFIRRLNKTRKQMEEALVKADEANKAKSQFLANMSHELRTPLNGVISVSDLLLETPLSKVQKEYTNTIHSSANTLLGLINDVLDFSKIENNRVSLDHVCFDLYASINDVLNIIRPLATKKGLTVHNNISTNTPRFIYGDPVRLKQVLLNLTNNAVKFTENGHISLHTYPTEVGEDHAHLSFEVIDTGIGISEAAQERIFERFMQEDDSITRRYGGTGLGISISKQLVELMGGVIGLSSTPGKGSRFWFEIDVSAASTQDFEYMQADVLVVSDNDKYIESWEKMLRSWNMRFVVRKSFRKGLEMLHKWEEVNKQRFILLDEDVLGMAPVRAAQMIRETGANRLSLFLITMNPMPEKNPDIQLYFDGVLDIPVDSRQLYNLLMRDNSEEELHESVISLSSHLKRKHMTACSLNILVAEDQTTNQFVFKSILEKEGHHVTIANDGQEALDLLSVEQFDITLIDLHMPEVSGLEVIKIYQYMSPDSKMPFIMVTANTTKEVLDECREYAELVLIKPVEKQKLLDKIHKVATFKTGNNTVHMEVGEFNDLPLLDKSGLDGMLGENIETEFLSELFQLFYADATNLIINVEQGLKSKSLLPEAKDKAHAIKGIANNVSAVRFAAIAKHCEQKILSEPDILEKRSQLIGALRICLEETYKAMQTYLRSGVTSIKDT